MQCPSFHIPMLRKRSLVLAAGLAAASLCFAADDTPTVPSLLPNGKFELDSKGAGWPDGWAHPAGSSWEKEGDTHFLRLKSSEPGKTVLLYELLTLPSPPPPALEFRLRVRYSDIKPGKENWFDGRIMGHFKDASGKVVKPDPGTPSFKGSSGGWVDKSYYVKVPASAHTMEIMPCLFQVASGTLDFARFEVFPAADDKLPKPPPIVPSQTMTMPEVSKLPPELHASGNHLETKDGKAVWLQGLCVDSLEWTAAGEHLAQTIPVAVDQWKANVIRLPVKQNFWFGRGPWQKGDGGIAYRKLVDDVVEAVTARGAYLVLDLHVFGAPMAEHVEFWKDAATRYKNNPGVIFELFNEPHSISWKVWRDGGPLKSDKHKDENAAENSEQQEGDVSTGMQALIDAVRSTGARNLVIAGGLDWGFDLSGVIKDYPLQDKDGADGIMYSSHIYPWKSDWQKHTLDAAAKYPVFIGEVGNLAKWEDFKFIPESARHEPVGVESQWPRDMIGMIQKNKLNWTAFSFHPKTGPMVILDWDYTPTPYWGVYVKDALAGKQFEMKRMR